MSKKIEVVIESLGGLGDGIASYNGKPVFVEKSAVGDELKVKITQESKEFIRAEILEIIKPSKQRISPPCPYFAECGGCSLQHLEIAAYQEFKKKIARNTLKQAGFLDDSDVFFLPPASRRRAEFKLMRKNGRLQFAYLASRSHQKIPIDNCLILEEDLQNILPILLKKLGKQVSVEEIERVHVTLADIGVLAVLNMVSGKKISIPLSETEKPYMQFGGQKIALTENVFLQASKEGARLLTQFALDECEGAEKILDLFCGIGTYSFPLAERASVLAADIDVHMIKSLKDCIGNLPLTAEARDLFKRPFLAKDLKDFDRIILNPPRAGAKAQVEEISKLKNKPKIIMISCNPASFARDAKMLKEAGYKLQKSIAVDQFVYSPHLEIAASFIA